MSVEAPVRLGDAGAVSLGRWRGVQVHATHLADVVAPGDLVLLDVAERLRAERFAFAQDAGRYVAAHAWLRRTLAHRRGIAAEALSFSQGAQGKPCCLTPGIPQFNLSHSGGLAWLAVAETGAIGVDVECLRAMPDAERLVATHFHPGERAAWAALPPDAREAAFLSVWTRKEACLKAIGCGLTVPPDVFDAGLGPDSVDVVVRHSGQAWTVAVTTLDGMPASIGAVAIVIDGSPVQ